MPDAPIRRTETRRTETPNATMTTFASPSLGPSAGLSLWQVQIEAGHSGPVHVFDSEQLWTVLGGELSVTRNGETVVLSDGDSIVLAAGVVRQIGATTGARAVVCGHGDAVATVPGEQSSRGTPAWIA